MANKRGPRGKWRWYLIKRVRDGSYLISYPVFRFGSRSKAIAYRLTPAFSLLCRMRRRCRERERKRKHRSAPETFVLEVKGDPKARVNYPWRMPS